MTLRLLTLALGGASLLLVCTGCPSPSDRNDDANIPEVGFHQVRPTHATAGNPETTRMPSSDDQPTEPTPAPRHQTTNITENVSSQPTAPVTGDFPYAVAVKDKPGLVTSPYAPESGYIDVRGQPPGQQMRDPYTNKIFLVP